MTLQVPIDRVGDVLRGLRALEEQHVYVGVPQEAAERDSDDDGKAPINNAALAYIHEHGAPEANIPPRPFLVPGTNLVKDYVAAQYKHMAVDAMEGRPDTVVRRLTSMGLKAVSAVRNYMTEAPFTPLKEGTLKSRARRGRKGAALELEMRAKGVAPDNSNARPLIDTAQLKNAITYVIRKGKGHAKT